MGSVGLGGSSPIDGHNNYYGISNFFFQGHNGSCSFPVVQEFFCSKFELPWKFPIRGTQSRDCVSGAVSWEFCIWGAGWALAWSCWYEGSAGPWSSLPPTVECCRRPDYLPQIGNSGKLHSCMKMNQNRAGCLGQPEYQLGMPPGQLIARLRVGGASQGKIQFRLVIYC